MDDRNGSPKDTERKRHPLAKALLALALAPVLAAALLVAFSAVFRRNPSDFVPPGYSAYASSDSAGALFTALLDLKATDMVFSGSGSDSVRGLARSLRSGEFIRTPLFRFVSDVRIDVAAYPNGGVIAVADLGIRSALTRLSPLLHRFLGVADLEYVRGSRPPRFEYGKGEGAIHLAFAGNVVIATPSAALMDEALATRGSPDTALASALVVRDRASRGKSALRVVARPGDLAKSMAARDDPLGRLVSAMDFAALATADIDATNERVSLKLDIPVTVRDEELAKLAAKRARSPSSLTRLPGSAAYFSVISAGTAEELWAACGSLLGKEALDTFRQADEGARALVRLGMDDIVFSWSGDEFGVAGLEGRNDPVFFARVRDERKRKAVFDALADSAVVDRDVSTVIDGIRIPRAVFPWYVRTALSVFGVALAEPYYYAEDGFLFLSASAETLALWVSDLRAGRLLVKTDRWKETLGRASTESQVLMFYDLDRSVPFFLRGSEDIASALRLYRRGVASLRFSDGAAIMSVQAVSPPAGGPSLLPGFPIDASGGVSGGFAVARGADGRARAYWTSGSDVLGADLASGKRFKAGMDDSGYVAARGDAVWAVSKKGTVSRMDGTLATVDGFPVVTGEAVSAPPSSLGDALVVALAGKSFLIVSPDAGVRFSDAFPAKILAAPATIETPEARIATAPRSFDSALFVLDPEGRILPAWPVALPGIVAASPAFGAETVAVVTESGSLVAFAPDAVPVAGFPVELATAFDAPPVFLPSYGSWFVVSRDGRIFRVSADGSREGEIAIERFGGKRSRIFPVDLDGDGREEIIAYGGADACYAFAGDLSPLPGFPLPGGDAAAAIDVDGDGRLDIVTFGADGKLRAYAIR